MPENLTENEIETLNYYKEEYDKHKSDSFASVQPKLNVKIIKDVPAMLQSKGYLEIKRKDFDDNNEMVSILLKDKFFDYFNISRD